MSNKEQEARSLPVNYDEIVREYQRVRAEIKIVEQRVNIYHSDREKERLLELRHWSRRLALAKAKHPDAPVQLPLF